ncbi:hypothetical protein GEMRC1_006427 [Eukaryota sp. GEM-RC1]
MPCRLRLTLLVQEVFSFNSNDIALVQLPEHQGLFLPADKQFYCVDPLTEEFVGILPYKSQKEREFNKRNQSIVKKSVVTSDSPSFDNHSLNQSDCCSAMEPSSVFDDFDDVDDIPGTKTVCIRLDIQNIYSILSTPVALGLKLFDSLPKSIKISVYFQNIQESFEVNDIKPSLSVIVNKSINVMFETDNISEFLESLQHCEVVLAFSINEVEFGKVCIGFSKFFDRESPLLDFSKQESFDIDLFNDGVMINVSDFLGEEVPWISTELSIFEIFEDIESFPHTHSVLNTKFAFKLEDIDQVSFFTTE